MALYRVDDPESTNQERLSLSLASLDRALALEPDLKAIVIRAWRGKSLVHCQRKDLTRAVDCVRRALDSDESDPSLWLLYSSMLKLALRNDEAVAAVDKAFAAYVAAGRPPGLDQLFGQGI